MSRAWLEVIGIAAAFGLGYLAGRMSGAIAQDRKPTRGVAVDVKAVGSKLDRFNRGPWVLTLTCVILIAIGVQAGISAQQHNSDSRGREALKSCVAQFENRLYESLKPRQAAAQRLQAADSEFNRAVLALFKPGHDKADVARVKAAAHHKQRVADSLTRLRDRNPYPAPPKKVCPQ